MAVLWVVQDEYIDSVAAEGVRVYQARLAEFLTTRKPELFARIAHEKAVDEALTAALKAAADRFQETWQ